jgi:hypothetical protein
VWDLASGQCRAAQPDLSPEGLHAQASVGTNRPLIPRRRDFFLEVGPAGTEEVIARFPGPFTAVACSPDGRHVVAGDGRGQVYFLRLRSRND